MNRMTNRLDEPDNAVALNEKIHKHHWWPAFQDRCPGWEALFCYMPQDEIIDFRRKIIWLRVRLPNPLFRWAHSTAHVMSVLDAALASFGTAAFTEADFERRVLDTVTEMFHGSISAAQEESADLAAMCWASYSPPYQMQGDMSEVA